MDVRSLGYRTDLMVRRLAGSSITDRERYLVVRSPHNPLFHWGNFLLFRSLPDGDEIEDWIRVFADEFPDAAYVALGVDGTTALTDLHVASTGLEVERDVVLRTERLRRARPSEGHAVRELGSDEDWNQVLDLRLDVSRDDGPLPADHGRFLERSTDEARSLVAAGHGAYFGAFSDDRLCSMVGIVSDGGPMARFQNVATRADRRRRGLAGDLLVRAGEFGLSELEARILVIVAEAGGSAAELYRSVGFRDAESQIGLSRSPSP